MIGCNWTDWSAFFGKLQPPLYLSWDLSRIHTSAHARAHTHVHAHTNGPIVAERPLCGVTDTSFLCWLVPHGSPHGTVLSPFVLNAYSTLEAQLKGSSLSYYFTLNTETFNRLLYLYVYIYVFLHTASNMVFLWGCVSVHLYLATYIYTSSPLSSHEYHMTCCYRGSQSWWSYSEVLEETANLQCLTVQR